MLGNSSVSWVMLHGERSSSLGSKVRRFYFKMNVEPAQMACPIIRWPSRICGESWTGSYDITHFYPWHRPYTSHPNDLDVFERAKAMPFRQFPEFPM